MPAEMDRIMTLHLNHNFFFLSVIFDWICLRNKTKSKLVFSIFITNIIAKVIETKCLIYGSLGQSVLSTVKGMLIVNRCCNNFRLSPQHIILTITTL